MTLKRLATTLLAILFLFGHSLAGEERDSIVVSLLTCWPGPEVYELCGHEAVRIRTASAVPRTASQIVDDLRQGKLTERDSVWNYGTFDFAQPNFIYRFVKGETDYMVYSYPTWMFLAEYKAQNRRVVEQDLNLSQDEAWKLLGMLRENALPENRTYRYNYVKDNCATRISAMLDKASQRHVVYPDSARYGTFRNTMRHYHRDYPWYQFGIDLALGSGIDYPLTGRDEMFAPLEMMDKSGGAHFEDGTPLVRETRTLNEGIPDATQGPTHWAVTPLVVCWAFFLIVLALCMTSIFRKRKGNTATKPASRSKSQRGRKQSAPRRSGIEIATKALYSLWFGILGIAGFLIVFLVFVSTHEATTPNILLLWINPLQLFLAFGVWLRGIGRQLAVAIAWTDIIVLSIMMIVWPMQAQSANPAFFPLMGATLLMAVTYAINSTKISYK